MDKELLLEGTRMQKRMTGLPIVVELSLISTKFQVLRQVVCNLRTNSETGLLLPSPVLQRNWSSESGGDLAKVTGSGRAEIWSRVWLFSLTTQSVCSLWWPRTTSAMDWSPVGGVASAWLPLYYGQLFRYFSDHMWPPVCWLILEAAGMR